MIKKIITLVGCLALCVSCIAVGVINQKADDTDITATADGAISGADLESISQKTYGEAGSLLVYDDVKDEYILTDNVTITRDEANKKSDPTYEALRKAFEVTAASTTAKTLNGNGMTITTEVPLFQGISNCTIKNLTVDGNIVAIDDDLIVNAATEAAKVGVIASVVYTSNKAVNGAELVKFENVTVDATLFYSTSEDVGINVSAAAFVGGAPHYANMSFIDCVNNGNITLELMKGVRVDGNEKLPSVAGFTGNCIHSTQYFENCVNNGNIKFSCNKYAESDRHYAIAGIAATNYGSGSFTAKNTVNTGNLEIDLTKTTDHTARRTRAAGILAWPGGPVDIQYCLNLGDIVMIDDITGANCRHGGIVSEMNIANIAVKNCINAGDIVFITGVSQPMGGITGYTGNAPTLENVINLGRVETSTSSDGSAGYIVGYEKSSSLNSYNLANFFYVNYTDSERSDSYKQAIYALGNNGKDKTASEINATRFSTGAGVANGNVVKFEASVNKSFYDLLNSIMTQIVTNNDNIDLGYGVGAIIAPARYDEVIPGDFTHNAFNAYLKANQDAINTKATEEQEEETVITALYMTASFKNGESLELDGEAYKANVTLKNADDTTYKARTYIKIGDAYVYSK